MSIESNILALAAAYATSNIQGNNAKDAFNDASGRSTWAAARADFDAAAENVSGFGQNITVYAGGATNYLCPNILLALNAKIDALATPEITMSDIIYAMLTAKPDEIMYFVGLCDAYRQSIWNDPYNQEFFAALARGFMF